MIKIEMPYMGYISSNKYKIFGTKKTRPEVENWMNALADKVRGVKMEPPIIVSLYGKFYDNRAPDLANLHKVVGDAIQAGLGINDKEYRFRDEGYEIGCARPIIIVTLESGG